MIERSHFFPETVSTLSIDSLETISSAERKLQWKQISLCFVQFKQQHSFFGKKLFLSNVILLCLEAEISKTKTNNFTVCTSLQDSVLSVQNIITTLLVNLKINQEL